MAKRRWEFNLKGQPHVVEFRHGYFLGNRTFVVDGVRTTQRGRPFMDHSGRYAFPLEGHAAAVWVSTNGFTYSYDLVVDGRSMSTGGETTRPPRPPAGTPRQQQILGLVTLIGAIALVAFGYRVTWDEYRLQTAGATAAGIVESKSTGSSRSGTNYYLTYLFVDATGNTWRGRDSVARATYDGAVPGNRFAVVYVPDEPRVNRFAFRDNTLGAVLVPVTAAALFVLGAYLVQSGGRRIKVQRRVAEVGQPVNATVRKVKTSSVRGIGDVITVEYEYDDPFGNRRRGRGPLMYPQEGLAYKVGGLARILIDPDRPQDSVLP
jgi:FAIM1 (Fas apoptotic inhibitory molecule) protein